MSNHFKRLKDFQNSSQKSYDIEANLRSWGLLGDTAIQREDSRTAKVMSFVARKKIIWHRFKLFILWMFIVKLFYSLSLPNANALVYYLGDVSGYMGIPKIEMGLMMALWTLPGPIIISEFIKYKNTKPMQSWVRIYDMFNKKLIEGFNHNWRQKKISDSEIQRKFRIRISKTKGLFRFFVFGALFSGGGSIAWTILNKWPDPYRHSILSYLWSFISVFWIYYNQKSIKSCLIIFNQICYYIILRFRKFDSNINHLFYNWNKYSETNARRLFALLREHDSISDLTLNCNKFWSLFIITNSAIKIPLLLLAIHATIFYDIPIAGRLVAIFMSASVFLYTTLIYYSAAQVEYASRRSYVVLNSLGMHRMPLPVRYKLLNTIQRMSSKRTGFDIYAIHTISYLRYFEIIITSCIGFLLVIGLRFTEMQKRIGEYADINNLDI